MRDILLGIFESDHIKAKINETVKPIFDRPARRQVLLLATLLSNAHLTIDPSFVKAVTGVDPFREFAPIKETADELFDISVDEFRIRSSIFSEYAVRHFVDSQEISQCVVDAAKVAAESPGERQYRVLMSSLMQYSNLSQLFKGRVGGNLAIIGIYETLRHDVRFNNEPLFWLQYAIAMIEDQKLLEALEFISTAYERAKDRKGFQTYQIDTQSLRALLLYETQHPPGEVEKIQEILDKLEIVNAMLSEDSHRFYAIRVLESVEPFIRKRRADLSTSEKVALTLWLSRLSDTLSKLPIELSYSPRIGQ